MSDRHDYPFKAEYAKSNRASCKGCRSNIGKDSLRLAIMVQSPMFDGKIPNWHHYACFWKKASVKSHADIHGFDSLRWDDQEKIKEKLSGGAGAPGDDTVPGSTHNDFSTEYAKSNRSTCRGCGDKIEKGVVRIAKIDSEGESMTVYGRPTELWHHVDCFNDNRDDLGFGPEMEPKKILGFGTLSKEDQAELVKKLGKGEKKKRKAEDPKVGGKKAKTEESPEEKELKEQNKLIWTLRDELYKNVSTDALRGLLEFNEQAIPSGESKLLDRVTDCMIFGALKPCKECKEGQLVYESSGYRCTGNVTSWTKCMNVTKKPSRKPFKVPAEYHDVECLKKYKYVPRVRAFPPDAVPSSSQPASSAAGGKSQPLEGMSFVIAGKLSKSKTELAKVIQGLGGSVASKVDKTVAACISNTAEVEKMSKHIKDAKKADVHVVNEEFVEAVKKGGAALLIKNHSLATWGGEPLDRIGTAGGGDTSRSAYKSGVSKREENKYTKSVPSKMKMMVKGGAAVDPASGLESSAHVLQEKGELYTAVLGLVDIAVGTNSYYKLQILESDKSNLYWVFRAWGRVGTTIGGNKLQKCGSKASCIEEFKALYLDKTGNEWENKKDFVKYPNKFYPLEIDYGADDEEIKKLDASAGSNSKLPTEVQDLVKMIFDVESMKKTMLEFEIDMKKMPLGKLSKRQIEQAYSVLNELSKLMEDGGTMTKVMDATNRFYTLIPHDFGLKKPPLLDNVELIKAKTEMLDNLLDIEVAYSLLRSGDGDAADPLDVHYKKLKTDIKVLDKKSEEFKRLKKYVKHTHAATHNQYDLEIEEIFKIVREGEAKVYKPFRDLHNRQLLWHGSRTTNYAGILSQGLRIAPPEAPVTGYMFGKGIYFADMVSKSANYCRTTKSDPTGLMLLCEVALGDMYERLHAEYVTKLPKGKHSTKGCGMTAPDPAGKYVDEDGLEIPMGKGRDLGLKNSSLLYNEFIVYDVAQVQMKYLLKMNFKFKW